MGPSIFLAPHLTPWYSISMEVLEMAAKIYEGPNGYYIATQDPEGSHGQPRDGGARLGWDRSAAERELRWHRASDTSVTGRLDEWDVSTD